MSPWLHAFASPLGFLQAAFNLDGALVYLGFRDHEPRGRLLRGLASDSRRLATHPDGIVSLRRELEAYFEGRRRTFDVPMQARGTPFQQRVWAELRRIPCGGVITYGELARRLGDARLARAVGTANGANPISILVPCHRVIGTDGSLTGYAGGLAQKQALLSLEGALDR